MRAEQRMSNIYKLYRACRVAPDTAIDPHEQVSFYDPGLGTETTGTGWTGTVRYVQKLVASVSGRGIADNIADCYEFIINHYESGDRIFLFGSRGAYTVRNVGNVLMLCGIPTRIGKAKFSSCSGTSGLVSTRPVAAAISDLLRYGTRPSCPSTP